jgi:hypothetical protein
VNPDIVIVRDGTGYRLLHGHLRLSNALRTCNEVFVNVAGVGKVKILKTRTGYIVGSGKQCLPLHEK